MSHFVDKTRLATRPHPTHTPPHHRAHHAHHTQAQSPVPVQYPAPNFNLTLFKSSFSCLVRATEYSSYIPYISGTWDMGLHIRGTRPAVWLESLAPQSPCDMQAAMQNPARRVTNRPGKAGPRPSQRGRGHGRGRAAGNGTVRWAPPRATEAAAGYPPILLVSY